MTDMLIKLYALPPFEPLLQSALRQGVAVRRAMVYEQRHLASWISDAFNDQWADECRAAFCRQPVCCYLALKEQVLCGFCCYDCTYRGFFGPIGVRTDVRAKGLGTALLLAALNAMHAMGYAYAIVGNAGATEFFKKAAGAIEIADSVPGAYPETMRWMKDTSKHVL